MHILVSVDPHAHSLTTSIKKANKTCQSEGLFCTKGLFPFAGAFTAMVNDFRPSVASSGPRSAKDVLKASKRRRKNSGIMPSVTANLERCEGAAAPSMSLHTMWRNGNAPFVVQSEGDGWLSPHVTTKTVIFVLEWYF